MNILREMKLNACRRRGYGAYTGMPNRQAEEWTAKMYLNNKRPEIRRMDFLIPIQPKE
jgi:hypothetical protein